MWPDEPDTMHTWMVVPYDGSPPARATLRRAATAISRAPTFYDGLLIATVGLERSALQGPLAEATEIAGPSLPIEIAWLSPADPIGAFRRFLAKADATLAVPLGGRGRAAWYVTACQASDTAARTMIFFLTPHELRAAAAASARTRAGGLPGALRRALAQLAPGHPQTTAYQHAQDRP